MKTYLITKYSQTKPRTWIVTLVLPKQRKRGIRFSTWKVRSLYGAGFLMAAARKLARHKLDLVGVQEFRWDKGGTVIAGDYNFFYGKEMKIINWEEDFLYTTE